MASAAYAGRLHHGRDPGQARRAGITVGDALDAIGYRGSEPVGAQAIGAFVELHIEQGPILEAEGKTIGVVEGGQGIIWFDGVITGFESHAGTTPMPRRRDALLALAEFALAAETIALAHAPSAVATIGEAAILAPSRNVVPGRVAFTLDVRDPRADHPRRYGGGSRADAAADIAGRRRLEIALDADLAQGTGAVRSRHRGGDRCGGREPRALRGAGSSRAPGTMPAISPRRCRPP